MITFRKRRGLHILMGATAAVMAISAYQPLVMFHWLLENILVFLMLGFLAATYRRLPLSNYAYTMIFLFLVIHEWGAHWSYTNHPAGEWLKTSMGASRNHFDRVAHFFFGVFFAVPIREAFVQTTGHRGFWSYFIPIEFALASGAAYEIIEMIVALLVSPEDGANFVGMQGDMWDAQVDMGLAAIGAMITMAVEFARRRGAS